MAFRSRKYAVCDPKLCELGVVTMALMMPKPHS